MRIILAGLASLALIACQPSDDGRNPESTNDLPATSPEAVEKSADAVASEALAAVLAAQPDDVKARYPYRHPQETLEFFEVRPGMTVVEALPGGGWYSRILLPYLGPDGTLIGADYAQGMWPLFGFFSAEFIESKATWVEDWTTEARGWGGGDGASVSAFVFGSLPDGKTGTADRVLFIRALHNLARFESQGQFLSKALEDAYTVLKPGGIVGVVQHHARDNMPDDWADGSHGYLKKSFVIEAMERAGFEFVGETDINANERDQPTFDDVVWRLPPSYQGSQNDAGKRAQLDEIGESNRMTLKFRKPE